MSPDHQQTGSGTMRRQLFSLSSVFRSQANKRASSMTVAVQEQPTCQERIHYPVFNPLDPRHNPDISTLSWHPQGQCSSSSGPRSPMAWVQSVSRRSLHKARSGLLALRSGLMHRSSEEETLDKSFVSPVALKRERQQHRGVSSEAHTTETQEDLKFGTELSRMDPTPSSSSVNSDVHPLMRAPSIHSIHRSPATLPASESTPELSEISDRAVSNSRVNMTLASDHDLDLQFAGAGDLGANMNSEDHFTHTTPSTENLLIEQTWGVAISTDEEIKMSASGLADSRPSWGEHQATNLQQQNISHASSDTEINDNQSSSVPISRQCSAEVRFAFPGIYQEALDQWARQHGSPSPSQHIIDTGHHSPNLSQQTLNLSQHNSSPSQHSPKLEEEEGIRCASQEPLECIVHQDDTYSNMSAYHEYDESLIPLVPPQTPIAHSEETQSFSYPNPLNFISNRNFGQRRSSISERATTQWSSVEDYSGRYTPDNTTSRDITSTEMTSMESMSNDTWSPIDSEVLFPSPVEDGNGYFLFDGKTNSQYPDRGNEPAKSAHNTTSNSGNTRGSQELTGGSLQGACPYGSYPMAFPVQDWILWKRIQTTSFTLGLCNQDRLGEILR
ncbi:hypothetical protein N7447_010758 [Penicillium robsamsonii]|uniref:uncharacterized protein n=1 Tax=Penicillium robsamsonii TaxID=1792511 RepID=UPI0025489CC1|nr:uncharacterized protein N7447_010758 [Penicillium robsamsonii]KAJ5811242.1 hypothetical protein N7447_010758 [Penicillium robsamsonii]